MAGVPMLVGAGGVPGVGAARMGSSCQRAIGGSVCQVGHGWVTWGSSYSHIPPPKDDVGLFFLSEELLCFVFVFFLSAP